MKILYCDCCGVKVGKHLNKIGIPCHLFSKKNEVGYVDNDFNRVSGRLDSVEVCNKCLNKLYSSLVSKFEEIKNKE